MSTPEQKASLLVRLRANQRGCRLMKNNTGVAYDQFNRPVFFGLDNEGKKGPDDIRTPDWVGWHNVLITPEMVGKSIPVFTAIDAKKLGFKRKDSYSKGTREFGQNKFFQQVKKVNGVAGFASCSADVDEIIDDFYKRIEG